MIRASYIITFRDSGDKRAENLLAVLSWLAREAELEVVLVEQDRAPRLPDTLPHAACRRVFAYNPGAFNKSWGYNVGARAATGAILAFGDADVVVGGDLRQAIDLCIAGYQAVKPYRRLFDLSDDESANVRAGDYAWRPARDAPAAGAREAPGETLPFCGGTFFIRRDGFARLGGWDERFVGWGGEDDAMTFKLERLRLSAVELDGDVALHLWHPRATEATYGQPHYAANVALLSAYRVLDDPALGRLAELQWSLMGNRDKHRPAT